MKIDDSKIHNVWDKCDHLAMILIFAIVISYAFTVYNVMYPLGLAMLIINIIVLVKVIEIQDTLHE